MRLSLGALGVAFYAVHAGQYVLRRQPENALWVCHLGALAVSVGLLFRWPAWIAVGAFWLALGVPFWILDLWSGGEFLPTSLLTHVGGLALGIWGLKRLGLPDGAWWKGVGALVAVNLFCRWATPPEQNVNLAHRIYEGWASTYSSHLFYLITLLALYAAVMVGLQFGLRRLGFKRPGEA